MGAMDSLAVYQGRQLIITERGQNPEGSWQPGVDRAIDHVGISISCVLDGVEHPVLHTLVLAELWCTCQGAAGETELCCFGVMCVVNRHRPCWDAQMTISEKLE